MSACRDPELQQVLRRIDEALCSPETEAQVRKGPEESPFVSDDSSLGFTPQRDLMMKFVDEPARALIRRAAAEGLTDVRDENGLTLLFVAMDFRLPEPVLYLLEHGADPNARDSARNRSALDEVLFYLSDEDISNIIWIDIINIFLFAKKRKICYPVRATHSAYESYPACYPHSHDSHV